MTRRKQYRRKVEDTANERFQALIEESKDFFFVIAPGGEITYRSPSVLMAGGDNPPEHLNDLLDMLSGVSRDIARTVFYDTAKATGQSCDKRSIMGTTPEVDTVTRRRDKP